MRDFRGITNKRDMNRITFTTMLHKVDYTLDALICNVLNSGIVSVSSDEFGYIIIEFRDGSKLKAWNLNQYYGWLHHGELTFPNKQSYAWEKVRPKRSTMIRIFEVIKLQNETI